MSLVSNLFGIATISATSLVMAEGVGYSFATGIGINQYLDDFAWNSIEYLSEQIEHTAPYASQIEDGGFFFDCKKAVDRGFRNIVPHYENYNEDLVEDIPYVHGIRPIGSQANRESCFIGTDVKDGQLEYRIQAQTAPNQRLVVMSPGVFVSDYFGQVTNQSRDYMRDLRPLTSSINVHGVELHIPNHYVRRSLQTVVHNNNVRPNYLSGNSDRAAQYAMYHPGFNNYINSSLDAYDVIGWNIRHHEPIYPYLSVVVFLPREQETLASLEQCKGNELQAAAFMQLLAQRAPRATTVTESIYFSSALPNFAKANVGSIHDYNIDLSKHVEGKLLYVQTEQAATKLKRVLAEHGVTANVALAAPVEKAGNDKRLYIRPMPSPAGYHLETGVADYLSSVPVDDSRFYVRRDERFLERLRKDPSYREADEYLYRYESYYIDDVRFNAGNDRHPIDGFLQKMEKQQKLSVCLDQIANLVSPAKTEYLERKVGEYIIRPNIR